MMRERGQASLWTSLWAIRGAVIALAAGLLMVCGILAAQPVSAASNFYIENYDIDMQVQEDDTYLITETLDVHFTAPSHGIYRVIPSHTTLRRDGQTSSFFAKVRDFRMLSGEDVEEERDDSDYRFRIGDADRYAAEDTIYRYSYVFDMRGDHLKGGDEVYYNMVGTSWEAQGIDHVTATVTFPKAIDMDNVGVKTGFDVSVPFEPEGDTVVKIDTTENVLSGLTIRAVLPEGYFSVQAGETRIPFYIVIALLLAAAVWGFFAWRKYGRDPQIVETEEFYPPEGLNPAEVAYLDSGELQGKHVTSMLLTLADKGYLKIVETEEVYGLRKNKTRVSYDIVKMKDGWDLPEDEREFMIGLFEDTGRDVVEQSDLVNSFYESVNQIKKQVQDRYEDMLWDERAQSCGRILRLIGTAGIIALVIICKITNGSPVFVGGGFLVGIVILIFTMALPLISFYGITSWINKTRRSVGKFIIGFIGWAVMFLIGLGMAVIFDTCMGAQIPFYILGLAAIFLLFLMAALCERRSDYYTGMLGKIRGYKNFLQVAEKDRMEMLAEQDPDYFYKNLAYAYALGVTTVFAERFASLAKEPPRWYDSPYGYGTTGNVFNTIAMVNAMDSMMSSVSSSMTSAPSSSSGGGSFSGGGGAGGGGGGSW